MIKTMVTLFIFIVVGTWAYNNPELAMSAGKGLYATGKLIVMDYIVPGVQWCIVKVQGLIT